ncbi:Rossmann-fold NAD(P)-binding domain-containing protein [Mongoliitalea daihaiensis]|uniref:epimerase n=1 Tax=Mongoliitalea daihaiensis TaxID=2782006 RepID=UPI001F3D92A2|nr:epimerase [Mongoliitalea daihaiensis]UJP66305.1 epimerase [Mongoliitalea daihaiensis]
MQRVSIIGFGWLGLPLGKYLQSIGYSVKGSATSKEKVDKLRQEGLTTYLFNLNPHPTGEGFNELFQTDILFINIPPRTRQLPATFHPEQIKYLRALIDQYGIKQVVYVSATSVYPDTNQVWQESDPLNSTNTGNLSLYQAEQLLLDDKQCDLTIIRFGGLLGVNRIPGRYFSGKEQVQGDSPVNYIHREDAVGLAAFILEQSIWNELINGVCPIHPLRKEVYEKNAADLGFLPPASYAQVQEPWKEISAAKIVSLGYQFKIPNPLDFWYEG